MLASTLAALVGASLALASATLGPSPSLSLLLSLTPTPLTRTLPGPDGSLAVSSSQSEKEALSHITYKEICYRNLYADTGALPLLSRSRSRPRSKPLTRRTIRRGLYHQTHDRGAHLRQCALPLPFSPLLPPAR